MFDLTPSKEADGMACRLALKNVEKKRGKAIVRGQVREERPSGEVVPCASAKGERILWTGNGGDSVRGTYKGHRQCRDMEVQWAVGSGTCLILTVISVCPGRLGTC